MRRGDGRRVPPSIPLPLPPANEVASVKIAAEELDQETLVLVRSILAQFPDVKSGETGRSPVDAIVTTLLRCMVEPNVSILASSGDIHRARAFLTEADDAEAERAVSAASARLPQPAEGTPRRRHAGDALRSFFRKPGTSTAAAASPTHAGAASASAASSSSASAAAVASPSSSAAAAAAAALATARVEPTVLRMSSVVATDTSHTHATATAAAAAGLGGRRAAAAGVPVGVCSQVCGRVVAVGGRATLDVWRLSETAEAEAGYAIDVPKTVTARRGKPAALVLSVTPRRANVRVRELFALCPRGQGARAVFALCLDAERAVFGVDPATLPCSRHRGFVVPHVLQALHGAFERAEGLECEGVFRIAPNRDMVANAKAALNAGSWDGAIPDPNAAAHLIKVWFRELPRPLLHGDAARAVESAEGAAQCVAVLRRMPARERHMLLWLVGVLADVVAHVKDTLMAAAPCAVVIGPNLFRSVDEDDALSARMMIMMKKVNGFIEVLVTEWASNPGLGFADEAVDFGEGEA